ncbi:MAG: L-seryl-tRNA(Sec) selenium transferase [Planctomycetota bacterium]
MSDHSSSLNSLMRQLPAVGTFLDSAEGALLSSEFGAGAARFAVRLLLDELRDGVKSGDIREVPDRPALAAEAARRLAMIARPAARRVINATGVMLHTNLGRAPLADDAIAAMVGAQHYTPLEADVETGKRSLRGQTAVAMLRELTGCEAAHVVNNNAAATLIVLNTIAGAAGKEVIISRGQLVEIGGAFRMPDVMERSGCILREVGTTNRTHLRDYEAAIGSSTGALMHVHTSNYRVRGFSGTPDIAELTALGKQHGLPVIDDIGSGALAPLQQFGSFSEPLVADSVAAGSDLICFSGDKLIGGPQCGLIIGKREWIAKLEKNPFARMFRVDKLTLAALEATLMHFINGTYASAIPFWRMLAMPLAEVAARADALVRAIGQLPAGYSMSVVDDISRIGSGSIPDEGVPTRVLRIAVANEAALEPFAKRLRMHQPGVFGRIQDGALLLDARTLLPGDEADLAAIVKAMAASE